MTSQAKTRDEERLSITNVDEASPLLQNGDAYGNANGNGTGKSNGNGTFPPSSPLGRCSDSSTVEEGEVSSADSAGDVETREGLPEIRKNMWMLLPAIGIGGKSCYIFSPASCLCGSIFFREKHFPAVPRRTRRSVLYCEGATSRAASIKWIQGPGICAF